MKSSGGGGSSAWNVATFPETLTDGTMNYSPTICVVGADWKDSMAATSAAVPMAFFMDPLPIIKVYCEPGRSRRLPRTGPFYSSSVASSRGAA